MTHGDAEALKSPVCTRGLTVNLRTAEEAATCPALPHHLRWAAPRISGVRRGRESLWPQAGDGSPRPGRIGDAKSLGLTGERPWSFKNGTHNGDKLGARVEVLALEAELSKNL